MSTLPFGLMAVGEAIQGAIRAGMVSISLAVSGSSAGAQGHCVDLLVDKMQAVARVCVTDRNDTVFVRFHAADGCRVLEFGNRNVN